MRRRAMFSVFAVVIAAAAPSFVSDAGWARVNAAGARVQLLEPGANPRAVLRLTPAATTVRRTLTFSTQITQSGVSSVSVGPLQIRTAISGTIAPAGPKGTIRVPYTYGGFQLLGTSVGTPQQLDSVRNSLGQFQGFSGEYTLSPSGAVLSNHFQIPSAVNSTVRSLLEQVSNQSDQLTVPLPTQPVGVGARWQGSTQLSAAGITLHQTYEYTLRSRDGPRLTLDVRYTQTAARQRVKSRGLPSGATVDVTNYHVAGAGTSVLDLSQIIPLSGHLAAQGVQEFRVQQGSQSGKLIQQVQLGIELATG